MSSATALCSQNLRAVDQNKDIIPAGCGRNLTRSFFVTDFGNWFLQAPFASRISSVRKPRCGHRCPSRMCYSYKHSYRNSIIYEALF